MIPRTKILFSKVSAQKLGNIWVMNYDGSDKIKITDVEDIRFNAIWSADGRIIWGSNPNRGQKFFISHADGSKKINLIDNSLPINSIIFDNKLKILLIEEDKLNKNAADFYFINSDGSDKQLLEGVQLKKDSDDGDVYYLWFIGPARTNILSPDGTKIVFFSKDAGNWDIYVAKLSGMPSVTPKPAPSSIPESNKLADAAYQYSKLFNSEFWGNEAQVKADEYLKSYTDPLSVTLKAAKDILTSVLGASKMNSAAGILDDLSKSYSAVSAAGNQGLLAGMNVKAEGIGGNTLSEEFTTLANLLKENKDPKQQLVVVSNKIELYRDMLMNPDKYDVSGEREWSETIKMFSANKNILLSMLDSAQQFVEALKINYGMEVAQTNAPPSQSSKRIPGFEALSALILIIIASIKIKRNKGNNYG